MGRELTLAERQLTRWMLEHGLAEARGFLPQLERAQVTDWRCPCGCASIDFEIDGLQKQPGGMEILADFTFGSGDSLSGIFVFANGGVLSGVEVTAPGGDAPQTLPLPGDLIPWEWTAR